jgi:hypothetical protein
MKRTVTLTPRRRATSITYRSGFVELDDARSLRVIRLDAADLPEDVLDLVGQELCEQAGIYGDPSVGDPIQYDELRIEQEGGEVEIVVYNRAILLFTTDSEGLPRIHQLCYRLDDLSALQAG